MTMKILGIDTTALSTSISLFDSEKDFPIHFNYVRKHNDSISWREMPFVLPEYHRKTLHTLTGIIEDSHSAIFRDIDYCAVSAFSGIRTCIDAGLTYVNQVIKSKCPGIKLICIDHQVGHIFSSWIGRMSTLQFPMLIFTSSGSHNALIYMKSKCNYDIITDGTPKIRYSEAEVFCGLGKVYYIVADNLLRHNHSKICGNDFTTFNNLVFSGRPVFLSEILDSITLPPYSFDFSPLIDIVDAILRREQRVRIKDVARSFYEAFAYLFIEQMRKILISYPCLQLHICGGLSNNEFIIEELKRKLRKPVFIPLKEFRYDNAAMIAHAGYLLNTYNLNVRLNSNIF